VSDKIWKKIDYFVGLILMVSIFALIILAASIEVRDSDLWLHLKTGDFILENKFVPAGDVLSCTIAGAPWVNHEWLFQVVAQLVYRAGGPDGLISMQVWVVVATFIVLLFLAYDKDKQLINVILLLLILLIYQSRFTIRPDIFSLLFLALYLYILAWHIDKRWSVYVLFVIQVLWSNFHGFFFLGPFLVILALTAELIKRHVKLPYEWNEIGRLTDVEYKRLLKILGIVIVACLVNPLTFEGAWYPIRVLFQISGESKLFFEHIQELQRPITLDTLFSMKHYMYYRILLFLSFLSFLFNRRKLDIGDLIIWSGFVGFSLIAIRNMVFFAFIAYLVCLTNFLSVSWKDVLPVRFKKQNIQRVTVLMLKIFLILWMGTRISNMSLSSYFDFDKLERKSVFGGIAQSDYPDKAAQFLVSNNVKGNFFNDFNSGAYLVGQCYPNIKVFIDGRTEVYGAKFFLRYEEIWRQGNGEVFEKFEEKYGISGALLNSSRDTIPKKVLKYFYGRDDWKMVYFDYDAVVFLKDTSENKELIDKFEIDLSNWAPKKIDLLELSSIRVTPYRFVNRAYTLEVLGFDDAALAEVHEALKISPAYLEPYKLMGKIYGKKEQHDKSFENFRIATMLFPIDISNRYNFALSYEKLNNYKNAIKQYKKIIKMTKKKTKAYFLLARAYLKNKEYNDAIETFLIAHGRDPKNIGDSLQIGDLFYEEGELEQSRRIYEMIIEENDKAVKIYNKLGLVLQELGLDQEAKSVFERGLSFDPEDEELKKSLGI